jgi:hypothetical protein
MEKIKKVFVNLEKKQVTIQEIKRISIFDNPKKRYVIESDCGGFSCIEIRNGKYYFVNYLRERDICGNYIYGSEKPIEQKELSENEVKEIIRKTIMQNGY